MRQTRCPRCNTLIRLRRNGTMSPHQGQNGAPCPGEHPGVAQARLDRQKAARAIVASIAPGPLKGRPRRAR